MQALKFGFGQSVLRREDDPLLRGVGRYIGDVAPRETLHAVVLRSPHAHARFHLDVTQARAMPGVHVVLTRAETDDLGLLPCTVELPNTVLDVPPYAILTRNEVRHVGDAIAFVVADTLEQAKDATETILVTWEELPHVIGATEAVLPGWVYAKSPKGFRYVTPNPSSRALNSSLGLPSTVKRVRSTISENRLAKFFSNCRKCASAVAESAYRS